MPRLVACVILLEQLAHHDQWATGWPVVRPGSFQWFKRGTDAAAGMYSSHRFGDVRYAPRPAGVPWMGSLAGVCGGF